ncbi:class I SAM-dependent methyltransferase [Aureimonas pseudogalii]|uniref:Ubiquinone/menaquinone biosynthesis C-methylase UbiE n=1 Tax=Aureimonas pseudogalii TaxID=1744844 RepID=A0A7W6H5R9_9HYPH|nr:class I SAM-dependent methyltransferase [Aureimonas pseudogalii]MBB3999076.1 ubiquinone/menaquinone biosynthesis C-methylase UbiE [Aureimonas pseudogalii]
MADDQFGPQADTYVASPVHASGADLERLGALAAASRPVRALDLGTGGGHVAYALSPHAGAVVACDLSLDMVAAVEREAARRSLANVTGTVAPAERLPFADGEFDLVASRFSAHHWADMACGLRETRRVLSAGGAAVFIDVVAPSVAVLDTHLQAVELLRAPSHVRDYRVSEWIATLEGAGFRIDEVRTWRLRMEFASWTARIATSPASTAAIRSLQTKAATATATYFAIEPDGSFALDVAWFGATAL